MDEKWKQVATQAVTSEEFKNRLVGDPVTIMSEFGLQIPNNVEVKTGTDKVLKFFLPEDASDELKAEIQWWRWRLDIIREFGREEKDQGVQQAAPEAEEGI